MCGRSGEREGEGGRWIEGIFRRVYRMRARGGCPMAPAFLLPAAGVLRGGCLRQLLPKHGILPTIVCRRLARVSSCLPRVAAGSCLREHALWARAYSLERAPGAVWRGPCWLHMPWAWSPILVRRPRESPNLPGCLRPSAPLPSSVRRRPSTRSAWRGVHCAAPGTRPAS